jgi:hypothetical protein
MYLGEEYVKENIIDTLFTSKYYIVLLFILIIFFILVFLVLLKVFIVNKWIYPLGKYV